MGAHDRRALENRSQDADLSQRRRNLRQVPAAHGPGSRSKGASSGNEALATQGAGSRVLGMENAGLIPKPEMVVKIVARGRVTNALVMVVFGPGPAPDLTLLYVRNGGDGLRSSSSVTKPMVPHRSRQVEGEAYWYFPE
jgi:hypothetical protein